jgi:hypothetical protein
MEPSGPVQACNGIALPVTYRIIFEKLTVPHLMRGIVALKGEHRSLIT